MNIRRLITFREIVYADGELPAVEPVTRVAACALIENPLAGLQSDNLDVLIGWGADLGARLVNECQAFLTRPAIAYGKAAIVGVDGEIEHAAAILHPRMGKPMREAIGGGQAIIPSNVKIGGPNSSIDVPIGNKDYIWSFNEIDTLTVTVGGAPRPKEILVITVLSDGGRPRLRVSKPSVASPAPGPSA